ncbi:hypothetical protein HDU91_003899, partial [Kappamyces sp. JEL0680]
NDGRPGPAVQRPSCQDPSRLCQEKQQRLYDDSRPALPRRCRRQVPPELHQQRGLLPPRPCCPRADGSRLVEQHVFARAAEKVHHRPKHPVGLSHRNEPHLSI